MKEATLKQARGERATSESVVKTGEGESEDELGKTSLLDSMGRNEPSAENRTLESPR